MGRFSAARKGCWRRRHRGPGSRADPAGHQGGPGGFRNSASPCTPPRPGTGQWGLRRTPNGVLTLGERGAYVNMHMNLRMAGWGRARAGPIVTILLLALGVAAPLASVRGAHAQQDLTQVLPMNEPTLVAEGPSPSLSGPFLEVVYNRGTALISVRARNA